MDIMSELGQKSGTNEFQPSVAAIRLYRLLQTLKRIDTQNDAEIIDHLF